jgi:putative oxidoreductase
MSSSLSLSQTDVRPRRPLHVSLWIAQILLAGMFGMVGFMKIATPIAVLAQKMAWVTGAPALVRFIGICELAGAIGLILPTAFKIVPKLAGFAATGLLAIMVLAVPFHIYRGEARVIAVPVLLGVLAAFVSWGVSEPLRFRHANE